MHFYLVTFILAFGTTYLITPLIRKLAIKIGAIDVPDERKIHSEPIARLGGLGIWAGFFLAVMVGFILAGATGSKLDFHVGLGIVLAGTLLMIVGMVDDIRGLRATTKLIFQIIATLMVIYFGVEINFFSNPFNGIIVIGGFAIPLTLIWIVGVTNAINLIDGLDGLATGVTVISSSTLFFVALRTHQIGAAILLLALAASSLAFLRYNFSPAKIFLGDSGSLLLGFVLATAATIGVLKTTLVVAMIVPILILGVPIFDTLWAIGRRLRNGKHPFQADNKHIHHLLLRAGFNQREAVLAIYTACFILSFIALVMALQK
ncbi:undecaprenyl-phosphate alpha-N-acetylglucosaminyl 1-phosphate transferase [Candidatus Saganbacteria bacterium CG08_land_8_20_14_0_20_45_16]|uniref:Undecaprenyl-phosphate alpha-N-acetylglucosaminyl 1-phosphate transferase n=1 Tax=Candidatus Saganbacteria bacterium CG08_land_8_20_14_0_20_45_16 TaxID=2014293 RepID=A0A2H0XWQ2_UNCSA|nr:MAG: undecaprenyl-phosphate alpha-N-acetylglucosaminyl 1-phosphate transferase [Candidatus Saganbacteria bacterium CG08_land_8_20_14_0_20_45_16]